MTPEEPIHVWFCSPDTHFAEVVGDALGAGFDLRINDRLDPAVATEQQSWWDVVLLDSRDAENVASVDAVLTLMDEIKRVNPPPPIMVMTGDDDRALTHKLIESGAYDTLTSPPDIVEFRLALRRAHKFHEVERELFLWRSRREICRTTF